MKKNHLISFIAGLAIGAVSGVLLGEEDKKKIKQVLHKQANRLCKEYENPIKEGAAKVKKFVKEHIK